MAKIVIIGAGSYVFARNLIPDLLCREELNGSTIVLVDIDETRLRFIEAFATTLARQAKSEGINVEIQGSLLRREALPGADYVVVSVRAPGLGLQALEIPARYGVRQSVGDTIGPGGVFYGLHHIPLLLEICRDVEELCPRAWVLNYTNPMSMISWAILENTSVNYVGLCHSVQGTANTLARYLSAPKEELSYWVAGINHMAWFLELKWKEQDAYPMLREKLEDPTVYSRPDYPGWEGQNIVKVEIFKAFGYFPTESSNHWSEYLPYFRKRPDLFRRYKLSDTFEMIMHGEDWKRRMNEERERIAHQMKEGRELPLTRSEEYCADIIRAMETDEPIRINGNVKNDGLITNLLDGCCVEVPCQVDAGGVKPLHVGELPPQCAAIDSAAIGVQRLAVKAAMEKSKELVLQAILLDPLTGAVLSLHDARDMVDDIFMSQAELLADYR